MTRPSDMQLEQLRDVDVFARALVGAALWPHQLEVARSSARYRVICAGRQVGKSRLLAILALHHAFTRAGSLTLVVSAGEAAAQRLLDEVASLASSAPLLSSSVVDESRSVVVLSNGSSIRSVAASAKQIRGWAVDLLIVDEAGFIDTEIWRAAEPSVIARPGSRVVVCSSPWGAADHFFRQLWRRGMDAPDEQVESWHWPSVLSPMVDAGLLEEIRLRESPMYFAREYLAEWQDSAGAFFTSAELAAATGSYGLVEPGGDAAAGVGTVVGGVDWGRSVDANTLVLVAVRAEPDGQGRPRYWVPWLEERFHFPYSDWIEHVVAVAQSFRFVGLAAETNGVGAMPVEILAQRMAEVGRPGVVVPMSTSARSKEDAFGFMQLLFQQGRLELPPHPGLLRQLGGLEFVHGDGGVTRIAVPERVGHDDLVMALSFAVLQLAGWELMTPDVGRIVGADELLSEDDELEYRLDGISGY